MPLTRRVKGTSRATAAVRETLEEEESSRKVQDPENGGCFDSSCDIMGNRATALLSAVIFLKMSDQRRCLNVCVVG